MSTRVDFALIQPLVYSLKTWLELRRRLPEFIDEGVGVHSDLPGTKIHLVGDSAPLFDRSLDGIESMSAAFDQLLAQARSYPCMIVPMPELSVVWSSDVVDWPTGIEITAVKTHLIVPRNGEMILLHLAAGTIAPRAFAAPERLLQREVRTAFCSVLDRQRESVSARLDSVVECLLGGPPPEAASAALEDSGGHLYTLAHATDDVLLGVLGRVHTIEEGTARDQSAALWPDRPQDPVYAHLGWSYSTIATTDRGLGYRLLFPLIAVNQAWYRYKELRGDLIDISRVVHRLETDRSLAAQTEFYNQVVLDVKIWEAERESFERSLQPVFRAVYDGLWRYWDTGESRTTVHEGIDYVRDFLDRKYNVKIATRENTQARILFVIAIFQLLSLFGLVSGYLYFWEKTSLPESVIFDSPITVWATLLSPIVVLILIAWLLVTFFRRHR